MIGHRVHTLRLIGNDIDTSHLVGHTAAKGKYQEGSNEEQGRCSVCGYTAARIVENDAQQSLKGKLLIGLGVTTAVLMMLSIAAPGRKKK